MELEAPTPDNVRALSDACFHEEVESGVAALGTVVEKT